MIRTLRTSILLIATFQFSISAFAEPHDPDDDAVLIAQPVGISASKSDSATIEDKARELIRKARLQSDARLYSRAETLITPSLSEYAEPELLILRATIRQARHDFAGAIEDLNNVIEQDPQNRQALITRAFVRMTQGDYPAALNDCQSLPVSAGQLVRTACMARLLGLTGKAATGYRLLSGALGQMPHADPQLRTWVHLILAEMATRIDTQVLAKSHFNQAVALSNNAPSVRSAYADYLVGAGEAANALSILTSDDMSDTALLTRIRAGQILAVDVDNEITQLQARFDIDRQQGAALHLREEARFLLDVIGNPEQALEVAKANFATQREPEDIYLLVAAAQASGDLSQAEAALNHRRTFGTEDRRVDAILELEAKR